MAESSSKFRYTALGPSNIRLVKVLPDSGETGIRCMLDAVQDTEADYAALSYCWGDTTSLQTIKINDAKFEVSLNLFNFLKMVAGGSLGLDNWFWIDAICINQMDDEEKTAQVQEMWRIYSNARIVYSWIGERQEYTAQAFEALNEIGTQAELLDLSTPSHKLNAENYTPPTPAAIDAVVPMTENKYFERMWIVQEMLHAKDLRLVSGTFSCKMYTLGIFCGILELLKDDPDIPDVSRNVSDTLWEYLLLDSRETQARYNALSEAIGDTRLRKCFDPRDKIYALLGLPSIRAINASHEHLKPDYSMSVEEVLIATLSWYDTSLPPDPYTQGPSPREITEAVAGIAFTLGIDLLEGPFRIWLEQRVHKSASRNIEVLVKHHSGEEIDCSGFTLQDIIHRGSLCQHLAEYDNDW